MTIHSNSITGFARAVSAKIEQVSHCRKIVSENNIPWLPKILAAVPRPQAELARQEAAVKASKPEGNASDLRSVTKDV